MIEVYMNKGQNSTVCEMLNKLGLNYSVFFTEEHEKYGLGSPMLKIYGVPVSETYAINKYTHFGTEE